MRSTSKTKCAIAAVVIALFSLSGTPGKLRCGETIDAERRDIVLGLAEDTIENLKTFRGVDADDICRMPVSSLKKALDRLSHPRPDFPGRARSLRHEQQLNENGEFDVQNWIRAREQVRQMRRFVRPMAAIDSTDWEEIGPGNIGGRIRSLAFDPDDATRIYAGTVSGGVWLTQDAGSSWAPTDDFMANLSVSTVIFDPTNSNVMYAGTGEGTFNHDNIRGLGIFRSADKGASWSSLVNTADSFDFYWVNRLVMLNDGSRLLAATHTGIWYSEDAGNTWSMAEPVDTDDLPAVGRTNDVDVHPTDDLMAVAGTWGAALYSKDGGLSWEQASGLDTITEERVEIAYARSDPDIVYAAIDNESGEVYKSEDGGQTYVLVNTGSAYMGSQGWYNNALWIDPTNADHVVVGGIDLWRSTDGGATLNKISTWWLEPASAHADHHFIIEHPDYDGNNNKQVYFANDGGVYTAVDIELAVDNVGWQELNNSLGITQFFGFGVAPDGRIVGGTQDNGTLIYTGNSEGWTATFGGDGGFSAADPTDSNYLYGEYIELQIHRSTNGGVFSEYIHDSDMRTGANFIAPFILDPNNANRLLGGAHELWLSENAKDPTPAWASIKGETPEDTPSSISAIAVAPGDSDIIYVGHNDGALYMSSDGTNTSPTWTQIGTAVLPQRYLMRIAINPTNTDIVYVSFGGYSPNNLWKSTDGGVTWNASSGAAPTGIPVAPIRAIAIHPVTTSEIHVGTEVGIFSSTDSGASWSISNDGPANVSVDELIWRGEGTLYAATHGRGMFRADLSAETPNTIIFPSVIDAVFSTQYTSAEGTISGLGVAVDMTVANGEYSLGCTGSYTTAPAIVSNGDTVCMRHTSAADYFAVVQTQLTIGTSTFNFESRTIVHASPKPDVFLRLASFANVNGNNNTDLGVLLRDPGTDRNQLYVMDGGNGKNIRTVLFGSELARSATTVPDTTGDLVPEAAVLLKGSLFARIKNVVKGTALGRPKFAANFDPVAFLSVGDAGGGIGPDLAVVGRDAATGKVQAQIKDVASGSPVKKIKFSKAFVPFAAVAVDNVGDSTAMEIAVLGINSNGTVQALVKDAQSGNVVGKVRFNKAYTPLAFIAVPDANGDRIHLAVLGRSASGAIQAQIRRVTDGALVSNVRFSKSYDPRGFVSFADSNGTGGGEIAVIGVNGAGRVRAQAREIADGATVKVMWFDRRYSPVDTIAINGVAGTGRNEIAVLGLTKSGKAQIQIKDLVTGDPVNNIPVP